MRGGQLSVPHGKDQIQLGDEVHVIAPTEQLPRTLQIFGHEESQARRIVIAGGGNVGLYLARMIEDKQPNVRVKIVEASRARAVEIAEKLTRTVVLHGPAL